MKFEKTVLDNGIRVLSENHADSKCVVTGFWINSGTRHETREQMGISHLLEHMVFKGTEKYSPLQLALAMEARGGDINAFTAREHTCFHTTSLKEDLDLSVDVLAQLCAFAKFSDKEFEKEKRVVQQEILMCADDLEEYVYDLYFEKIFPDSPLGFQILGNMETVDKLSLNDIQNYYDTHFVPENMIVTAAGAVDHKALVKEVEKGFSQKTWKNKSYQAKLEAPVHKPINDFFKKDCEQFHIVMGFPTCAFSDEDRFNAYVVNTALGGGMTSKLYQKIREDRGLVYSVFSMLNTFVDTGLQTIYAGTERKHAAEVIDLISKEVDELRKNGLSQDEIELYKTQAKGQIVIGGEDIDNRMNSIAVNEMVFGEYRPVDKVISEIDEVTADSVKNYIDKYLKPDNLSLYCLGPKGL